MITFKCQAVQINSRPFQFVAISIVDTTNSAFSRYLKHLPIAVLAGYRAFYLICFNVCACYFVHGYLPYETIKSPILFLYNSLRSISFILLILCLTKMRLGDVTALFFAATIYSDIFARIFLKAPFGVLNVLKTIIGRLYNGAIWNTLKCVNSVSFQTKIVLTQFWFYCILYNVYIMLYIGW